MSEIADWMEREVSEYDLDLIVPPKTVLDIGANVGAFSLRAAARWPEARIFAFDPLPENSHQFLNNCIQESRIVYEEAAVRGFTGSAVLNIGDEGVSAGFHKLGRESGETLQVRCTDAASLPPAELIKIDTEGCELEIIERLDLSQCQALVCEYHRGDSAAIQDVLLKAGLFHVEHRRASDTHGLLKYARRAVLHRPAGMPANPIPDEMRLSGVRADGVNVSLTAGSVRTPFYQPDLHGKKLFLGIPVYSEMKTHFVECLLALQARKPLPIEVHFAQGDGVARSRNHLTAEFLRGDCTHLLMIDSDLIFSPEHVARIVSHDVDVVGGAYPKKQEGPLEWVINTLPDQSLTPEPNGLLAVRYVGTGFICVRRAAFERIRAAYPASAYVADYGDRREEFDYWPMSVYRHAPDDPGRYLSEDWFFCQRWLDVGGTVYLDARTILKHVGPAVYPLASQESQITKPK